MVHGDLWQGNTLWEKGNCVGILDWDCAGVGAGGIDLGSLRCDVALVFGEDAPAEVALGWEEEIGEAPSALPYWDAVSCLAAPSNLSHWLAAFHAQGRIDLTIETLTARRDAFLEAALVELR